MNKIVTPWFRFKGIDSREMGLIVTVMPQNARAEMDVQKIEVVGRSGTLYEDRGTFKSYTKTMECAVKDRSQIERISAWLRGAGEIIFATEPERVYRVIMLNKIDIVGMMKAFNKFSITMEVFPFKTSATKAQDLIEIASPSKITNQGTYEADPILTIFGNNDLDIIINNVVYQLKNVVEYVTINSEIQEVYKNQENKNGNFIADNFPTFAVGENEISWNGAVDLIKIEPNWRWL